MATCPTCGTDARDGAWTCGTCGSPLGRSAANDTYQEPAHDKAYYDAPTAYGTTAPTMQPLRSGKTSGSILPWLVALAIVAIVAVVGVWFFVLKPAPGAQFLGTWQGTQSTAAGNQVPYTMTIAKNGSLYLITQRIGKQTVGPFSAAFKDGHLESTYVYTGHDAVQAAAVATVKNMEAVIYKDFKVIFAVESGSLTVSVQGTPRTPGTVTVTQTVKLTKAG